MSETTTLPAPEAALNLPTHLDLPDQDGVPMMNEQQPPQSSLLTESLSPRLREICPEGDFLIGEDLGIYWDIFTDEPLRGARAPDWSCFLGVRRLPDGEPRRSYVIWHEIVRPLLVIEYVSGDGAEEHDQTPNTGKFWVYEQRIQARYYVIFDRFQDSLEVYRLEASGYVPVPANEHGRFPIEPLGVELGLWYGRFRELDLVWTRVWDHTTGQLLPSLVEVSEGHRLQAEAARRAEQTERRRAAAAQRAELVERQRAKTAENQLAAQQQQSQEQIRILLERLRAAGLEPPESSDAQR